MRLKDACSNRRKLVTSVAGMHVTGVASAQERDPRSICNLHAWLRGTPVVAAALLVVPQSQSQPVAKSQPQSLSSGSIHAHMCTCHTLRDELQMVAR
jgi:hypothetical protein